MSNTLQGKKVAILAADGVEKVELEQPRSVLSEHGAQVALLSLKTDDIQARNHDLEPAGTFPVDQAVSQVSVDEFDALVLPGGTVNPDKLRLDDTAVSFVRDFVNSGKPVAAICHGPWTLVEAGVVAGRTVTSYPSIRTDLRNAGGNVVDEEVVVDRNLITSRSRSDLPAFCAALVKQLEQAPARSGRLGWRIRFRDRGLWAFVPASREHHGRYDLERPKGPSLFPHGGVRSISTVFTPRNMNRNC